MAGLFQFRQSPLNSQIPRFMAATIGPDASQRKASMMDKIAQFKEILALDPKNSFARYGIAMEFVNRSETAAALAEFDILLSNDPDYTPGYFMAAQALTAAGRKPEAIERLKAGIASATRSANSHAINEMQAMLEEILR
jgi:predicted Zn-dependent protease